MAITRIVDAEGNVLEDYKVPQGEQVIDPRAAYMITNILSDPAAKLFTYGPNTPLMLHQSDDPKAPLWPAASKTGTTDNYRDTWTDGYTPNLAIVVWVGNADGHPMHQTLSTLTAAKVWPASMKAVVRLLPACSREDFPRPDGLVERQVCGDTRMRPGAPLCWNDLFFAENAPKGTVQAGPRPAPQATAAADPPDARSQPPAAQPPHGPPPSRRSRPLLRRSPTQPQPSQPPQPPAASPAKPTAARTAASRSPRPLRRPPQPKPATHPRPPSPSPPRSHTR